MTRSRRDFLRFSALATLGATASGCCGLFRHNLWRQAPRRRPPGVVDAHSHIFNGRDISPFGYIEPMLEEIGFVRSLLTPFAVAVEACILQYAPTARRELQEVRSVMAAGGFAALRARADEHRSQALKRALDLWKNAKPALELALDYAAHDPVRQAFLEKRIQEGGLRGRLNGELAKRAGRGISEAAKALKRADLVSDFQAFIARLLCPRYANAFALLDTFGERVNEYAVAMVDFGRWLEDPFHDPETTADQVAVMTEIVQVFAQAGQPPLRVFLGFDPLREVAWRCERRGAAEPMRTAFDVLGDRRVFTGFKLYPPMGYRPTGNVEDLEFPPGPADTIKAAGGAAAFARLLDEVLMEFFETCAARDLPIMSHVFPSHGGRPGLYRKTHPGHWARLLGRPACRTLRLNLGHFGGMENLGCRSANGWPARIALLMQSFPHVYADTGHFVEVANPRYRRGFVDGLGEIIRQFPVVGERLMYGSDWFMFAALGTPAAPYTDLLLALVEQEWPDLAPGYAAANFRRFAGTSA